jgi:hypothetical protein
MFSFQVLVDEGENYYQHCLLVKTDTIDISFEPGSHLPSSVDPHAKKASVQFSATNGHVILAWDPQKVSITLASYGDDKGLLSCSIPKTDDSLVKALEDWIHYTEFDTRWYKKEQEYKKEVTSPCEACENKKSITKRKQEEDMSMFEQNKRTAFQNLHFACKQVDSSPIFGA